LKDVSNCYQSGVLSKSSVFFQIEMPLNYGMHRTALGAAADA
jgi:hypothetical protein